MSDEWWEFSRIVIYLFIVVFAFGTLVVGLFLARKEERKRLGLTNRAGLLITSGIGFAGGVAWSTTMPTPWWGHVLLWAIMMGATAVCVMRLEKPLSWGLISTGVAFHALLAGLLLGISNGDVDELMGDALAGVILYYPILLGCTIGLILSAINLRQTTVPSPRPDNYESF